VTSPVRATWDDPASLEETLAILSDSATMAQIRESNRQLDDDEPRATLAEVGIALDACREHAAESG
jgi:hypothetical protein